MRAIVRKQYGEADQLALEERPRPGQLREARRLMEPDQAGGKIVAAL